MLRTVVIWLGGTCGSGATDLVVAGCWRMLRRGVFRVARVDG